MPFTPSHAVVALPFIRTPLVPAAIAVGAMTPDLPLFIRVFPVPYGRTHDLAWLPVTILIALGLLLVWRAVVRPAVRELSPRPLATRLPLEWDRGSAAALRETFGVRRAPDGAWAGSWVAVALLLASLALGVLSHIVWDLFTHEGRWGVAALPALGEQWGSLPGFKWLQHGSSIAGLAIIGVWAILWLRRRDAAAPLVRIAPSWVRWSWWLSLPLVLVAAWLWAIALHGPVGATLTVQEMAYRAFPPAAGVWGIATVALCVAIQLVRAVRARRRSPSGTA